MARESIYYYNYFRGFFVFIIVILILILVCTFRRIRLFTFYLYNIVLHLVSLKEKDYPLVCDAHYYKTDLPFPP